MQNRDQATWTKGVFLYVVIYKILPAVVLQKQIQQEKLFHLAANLAGTGERDRTSAPRHFYFDFAIAFASPFRTAGTEAKAGGGGRARSAAVVADRVQVPRTGARGRGLPAACG